MATDAPPLLALDSASLYFRSYFALPESMTAPDGHPNNAVRGFLSTLARLVDAHRPDRMIACWDEDWRPQWRVDLIPSYKAHRVAQEATSESEAEGSSAWVEVEPETLGPQAEAIAGLLDAMGIARLGFPGFEADDVAGSVAAQCTAPVIVVSGDRDLVQLVSESTRLLLTVNGGMEKWPLLDAAGVLDRFGVPPERYVDLAVLRGDSSDGLPGVSGIGAKTAAALVLAFGDVESVLAAAMAAPVRPMTARLAAALRDASAYVRAGRVVAGVVTELPVTDVDPRIPIEPVDERALASLAASWGVERQVADVYAALARAATG